MLPMTQGFRSFAFDAIILKVQDPQSVPCAAMGTIVTGCDRLFQVWADKSFTVGSLQAGAKRNASSRLAKSHASEARPLTMSPPPRATLKTAEDDTEPPD